MTINYQVNYNGYASDVDDLFIRKDVFSTGGLWSWGRNNYGQLGDNTRVNKSTPVQTIAGGTNWKQISSGTLHVAAIKTDGSLWSWGKNNYGQLGTSDTTSRSSPTQIIGGGTNWKQVSCGYYHTAAIKTNGTLWSWGRNYSGELGIGIIGLANSSPIQVTGGGTNWKQVSCGEQYSGAIKTDGTLWFWGDNGYGVFGLNNTSSYSSPIQLTGGGTNWKQVSCGLSVMAAIKEDGTLWLCGRNDYGQLGIGITNPATKGNSSPVQTIAGGTNWKQVVCSIFISAAIKTDGTLWTWGYNGSGQLGDNTIVNKSSPVQTIAGGTNWKQVATAKHYGHITSAIKTDGTLWLWGDNGYGQLGDNTQGNKSSPVQTISSGTNWKQVDCGYFHTIAIREDYY